MTFRK